MKICEYIGCVDTRRHIDIHRIPYKGVIVMTLDDPYYIPLVASSDTRFPCFSSRPAWFSTRLSPSRIALSCVPLRLSQVPSLDL